MNVCSARIGIDHPNQPHPCGKILFHLDVDLAVKIVWRDDFDNEVGGNRVISACNAITRQSPFPNE